MAISPIQKSLIWSSWKVSVACDLGNCQWKENSWVSFHADDDDTADKKGDKENLDALAKCDDSINDKSMCGENGTVGAHLLIQQANERVTIAHSSEHTEL